VKAAGFHVVLRVTLGDLIFWALAVVCLFVVIPWLAWNARRKRHR
jgi:uncharacterized membrane protein YqjE